MPTGVAAVWYQKQCNHNHLNAFIHKTSGLLLNSSLDQEAIITKSDE